MPDFRSWKTFSSQNRWRKHTQQLHLLGFLLLAAAAAVQAIFFVQQGKEEITDGIKNIGQPMIWRSANFSTSRKFADFVVFLHRHIPREATVYWPSSDTGSSLPGATFMQVLLYPRKLAQCATAGCEDKVFDERSYLVIADDFPGEGALAQSTEQLAFDERWGLITFHPAGISEDTSPPAFQSLFQAVLSALLPVFWIVLLALSGGLVVHSLLPLEKLLFKATTGFGLGLGLLTIAASLISMAGIRLNTQVLIIISLLLVAAAALVYQQKNRKKEEDPKWRFSLQALKPPRVDGWILVFIGLATISAVVSVSKAYHVSDELLIWAPKGYGIAGSGALGSAAEWGTETLHYPLHIPLLIAATNLLFGDILPAAKLIFSFYFLALLLLLYDQMKHSGARPPVAGLGTLLVATTPIIFRHSTIAYANLPFTFNLLAATFLLIRGLENTERSTIQKLFLLSGSFFCLASWTRPEGIWMAWLVLLFFAILWRFNRCGVEWRDWIWLLAPLVAYQAFWWAVSRNAYPVEVERSQIGLRALGAVLVGDFHLQEGLYVLSSVFSRLGRFETWGVWGIGVLAATVIGVVMGLRGDRLGWLPLATGLLMTGLIIVMYYITSYDTNHDVSWWVSTGLERMLFPGMLLLWAGGIGLVFGGRNHRDVE